MRVSVRLKINGAEALFDCEVTRARFESSWVIAFSTSVWKIAGGTRSCASTPSTMRS